MSKETTAAKPQEVKATNDNLFQKVISHAKEYGFVFQSSEIYDGLASVYDYGQNGVELKNNLKLCWWKSMTQLHDNIVGIDAAILMHPKTWVASGHVASFADPMLDNKDSKKRYRADQLLEKHADELIAKGEATKAQQVLDEMNKCLNDNDLKALLDLIIAEKIKCPISGTANWTEIRQFNLMFSTQLGAMAEEASEIYLRPETAQGIFVNYLNVQKTGRMKLPFGIAQIGKAFRNEIVARQFIFRMREFEQMEMQFFIQPGTQKEWYEQWKATRLQWHKALGLPTEKLQYHDHVKLAHYADAAVDIEFEFPFGFKEMEGIHSRTDFDLTQHQELSKKKQQYYDNDINKNYVPYVIETSVGADRLFLAHLCNAYTETTGLDANDEAKRRIYLDFHPAIAPIKAAIFPLTKKDGLPEKAMQIFNRCKSKFKITYEAQDSIGKRYTRQDLLGTPFCITVDHQTLEDDTVTLRHRNSAEQERIKIDDLIEKIEYSTSMERILELL